MIAKDGDSYKRVAKNKKIDTKNLLKLVREERLDKEDKYKCCLL